MLKNYLKIAWRNLNKNRTYSLINIGGLAIGITVVTLIGLWIHDEISFNKNHKNYDKIAQILIQKTANGNTRTRTPIPYPLGNELRAKHGDNFEYVVMSSYQGDDVLSKDNRRFKKNGAYMEADVLKLLSLDMIHGDLDALNKLNTIVISEATANTFFGNKNPIGEILQIGNRFNVEVTGVYKDLPFNSEFYELEFISTWELYTVSYPWVKSARDKNKWGNNSYILYAQITQNTTMASVNENIKNVVYDNVSEYTKKSKPKLVLHPMKNWHLLSEWKNGKNVGGLIQYVWLFGIIGLFVLLLACINFMNLSTAQSEKRTKEVGVQKTMGASKYQLINQFLCESFLVVTIAFSIAVLLVFIALPSFNKLADKQIQFPHNNFTFFLVCILFIIVTSLFAGSYPAFYLSSFQPIKVLKGTFKTSKSATTFRKVLVVIQFTISITLVIGTIIVNKQINYSKGRPLGYEQEGLIMISKDTEDYEGKYNTIRHHLVNSGAVVEMSESSSPLTGVWSTNGGFEWEGKDPDFLTNICTVSVSHDYGKTIGWNLTQGRDFSREFATDSTAFILNEAAVAYMGLKDPVGKTIRWDNQTHKVIGVVKDLLVESPFEPIRQAVYTIKYDNTNWINIKLNPQKSISESLATVESVLTKHIPNVPFNFEFVDETFGRKFKIIERIRSLSTLFMLFAILISCLGLFGLASFMAEQRTKEIGIRKVVGASVINLWQLLSKDFVKLIALAILVATPISFYGISNWLNNYTYHTEISWWIFVITGCVSMLIALISVSFHVIKASLANPIKSLKTE